MVRRRLTSLVAAVGLFAGFNVVAQPANSVADARDRADLTEVGVPCGEKTEVKAEITVGAAGPRRGIVGLSDDFGWGGETLPSAVVLYDANLSMGPAIEAGNCPAFAQRAAMLRPSTRSSRAPTVRAGPFLIRDSAGYFDLRDEKGRRAAVGWVRQTMAAVHSCWTDRSDVDPAALRRVRHLYAGLGANRP